MKLRHKVIRTYLKLTDKTDYKSKSDYWPWIHISPVGANKYSIYYAGKEICRSSSFADFGNSMDKVAIVGSGPSVSMMCFDKLSQLKCILLNGAMALIRDQNINPLACVIIDSTFVENRYDLLQVLPEGSNLILAPGAIRAIAERNPNFLSAMNVYLTQNIAHPCYYPGPHFENSQKEALEQNFSSNLDCGYVDGGTVMAVAIQLASQISVKDTYLVGLDIGNSASPRFYETNKNKQKCGLLQAYETSILPFMKVTAARFRASQMSIYNCSPISALPYSVVPYSNYFAKQDYQPADKVE